MNVLSVRELRKSFSTGWLTKGPEVLKGVSFDIAPGTITGFLGANGAGKTTTIKCILELIHADSGKVQFFGEKGFGAQARKSVGFLPERPYFYDYLTGEEFLRFYGRIAGMSSGAELNSRIDELLERVNLTHARKKALRDYSKGMLQRVGVAQALIHKPKFVILDEPMSGLDPDGRFEVQEIIRETAAEGTSIFFSSHLLHDAEKLCERLVVMKAGEIIFQGKTGELLGRFGAQTVVRYKDAEQERTEKIEDSESVDQVLDRLRGEKKSIIEVRRETQSLERAFVEMTKAGPEA